MRYGEVLNALVRDSSSFSGLNASWMSFKGATTGWTCALILKWKSKPSGRIR
jgi:hypothetical protein